MNDKKKYFGVLRQYEDFTYGGLRTLKIIEDEFDRLAQRETELAAANHCVYEGAAQWEQEYKDCRFILQKLVDLKAVKDADGQTPYYLEQKPLAWQEAKEFLKKYQHQ